MTKEGNGRRGPGEVRTNKANMKDRMTGGCQARPSDFLIMAHRMLPICCGPGSTEVLLNLAWRGAWLGLHAWLRAPRELQIGVMGLRCGRFHI